MWYFNMKQKFYLVDYSVWCKQVIANAWQILNQKGWNKGDAEATTQEQTSWFMKVIKYC
jgi:leucyl-tRNA synthetase